VQGLRRKRERWSDGGKERGLTQPRFPLKEKGESEHRGMI